MNDMEKYFPSRFLGADAEGVRDGIVVEIESVRDEELKQKEGDQLKPIVKLKEFEKELVLNKTNFATIAEITRSSDMGTWSGKKLKLRIVPVNTPDGIKDAIRFQAPDSGEVSKQKALGG